MNENKLASMDAVGELPDFGNLLLRESGYPHLKDTSAWNCASTKPATSGVYETKVGRDHVLAFQYWDGEKFCFACGDKKRALNFKGYSP